MLVDLTHKELEILIKWNRDKQYDESQKESYLDADNYRIRTAILAEIMGMPVFKT